MLDAASWKASDAGMPVSGLGVPLSVWPDGLPLGVLSDRLVEGFSRAGDVVATTVLEGVAGVAVLGRRLVVLCRPRQLPAVEKDLASLSSSDRALVRVEAVTGQNLRSRLADSRGVVDLFITGQESSTGEGFWSAASCAVRPGGLLVVVCASGDALVHADVTSRAGAVGWRYVQHIVATTVEVLDTEAGTDVETAPPLPGRAHRRAHADVLLFTRADDGGAL